MENYKNSISKQNEYKRLEVNEKLKHENKIVENIKSNYISLFKYENSKTENSQKC